MESPDTAFNIYIEIGTSFQRENIVVGRNVINKYEGRLAIFEDLFKPNCFVSTRYKPPPL